MSGSAPDRDGGTPARGRGALARILLTWFAGEDGRARAARAALDYIEAHRSAAGPTPACLDDSLPPHPTLP